MVYKRKTYIHCEYCWFNLNYQYKSIVVRLVKVNKKKKKKKTFHLIIPVMLLQQCVVCQKRGEGGGSVAVCL